jgi:hypothetical protein
MRNIRSLVLGLLLVSLAGCVAPKLNESFLDDGTRGSGGTVAFCRTPPNKVATFIYQEVYINDVLVAEVAKGKVLAVPVNIGETLEVKLRDKSNIFDSGDPWFSISIETMDERRVVITPKTSLSTASTVLLGKEQMALAQKDLKSRYFDAKYVSKEVFDQNCARLD